MNLIFFISSTEPWHRTQAYALAGEQRKAGYRVHLLDRSTMKWAQNALIYGAYVAGYFAFHKRAIVHIFGVEGLWVAPFLRVLHPMSKIIAHVDNANECRGMSRMQKIGARMAHMCITSRNNEKAQHALGSGVTYMPYAMETSPIATDMTLVEAHGLMYHQYLLGLVNPEKWSDVEMIIRDWRMHVKPKAPGMILALAFTKDIPATHIAFGSDVRVLGKLTPYMERMLTCGARAVITPRFYGYHMELVKGMANSTYAIPLRETVEQNPFALAELKEMYEEEGHVIEDMLDPALAMSWGFMAGTVMKEKHKPEHIARAYENMYEELLVRGALVMRTRI